MRIRLGQLDVDWTDACKAESCGEDGFLASSTASDVT
jgi:hypothetical protein